MTITCVLVALGATAATRSALWGSDGEAWKPDSRLPDFSFAGYHCGEAALPTVRRGVSIREFGAKGDGVTDDSQAFLDALARVKGAIEVPAGRYKITKILEVTRPGVVLRGEGPDRTVLFFPIPLNDIKPNWGATTTGDRTSNYSWSGGFLWFKGAPPRKVLAGVIAEAKRGAQTVQISNAGQVKPGQRIEITERDPGDHSLIAELYSGDPGDTHNLRRARASLICRVTKVEGNSISIDRPLRCALKTMWNPEVIAFEPAVTESGVENFCFEFPNTPYKGHFTEFGCNAIAMNGVADCWARNIRILNSDSGIFAGGNFCTFQNIVFESQRQTEKSRTATGHHGFSFDANDNFFTDFHFKTRFIHDITVSGCAGNVASRGDGVDICFDHHKYAPYENLFSDIDLGEGSRAWQCGGGAALGRNSGARETFWNLRARRPIAYPPTSFGPVSMNLVGIVTGAGAVADPAGKWFEAVKPGTIVEPRDLHEAQLRHRVRSTVRAELETSEPWLGPYTGPTRNDIDATTLDGKVLCGYQGWFNTPCDGTGFGFTHWGQGLNRTNGGHFTVDMWPDVSEYNPQDLCDVPGLAMRDGSPARLYSAFRKGPVLLHTAWMRQYGIDGVFLSRFLGEANSPSRSRHVNQVLANVREGCHREGRVWAMMLDLSMGRDGSTSMVMKDWKFLCDKVKVREDSRYLHHNGKPVVLLWGLGFKDRPWTAEQGEELIHFFKHDPQYGGVYLIGGIDPQWRTLGGASRTNAGWAKVYRMFDSISPWDAGRYRDDASMDRVRTNVWERDLAELKQSGTGYMPTAFPGFSWDNLRRVEPGKTMIARRKGEFYWRQFAIFKELGVRTVFVGMFDEVDEGTAIYKVSNETPVGKYFVTYEGLPSDWYLKLTGAATEMIRGQAPVSKTIPAKLQAVAR